MPTKTLTIEIPENLYLSLKECSHNEAKVEHTIINILEERFEEKNYRSHDPIFQPISAKGSGIHDIAENHDHYLYE